MNFWKRLYWRILPVYIGPWTIFLGLLTISFFVVGIWYAETWNERNCDASVLQAETELADALKEIRATGPLDTMHSPSCPVYRNFVRVAERTMAKAGACNRPNNHDTSRADFRTYVAGIKQLASERCPPEH